MHGQSRRPSAVSPQASLGPPCLNWLFLEPRSGFVSCLEGHGLLFYAERLLEFPLGVLGAAVGMAAAPRLAELAASEGLSRSSRFHEIPPFSLSQPQKPEQADPPPPLSASRTARNDTKAIPGARLQKPWDGEGLEFEDGEPFFKRGEPPHGSLSPSPSSLPTALPTPSRMKSSGRRCCRSA